MFIVLLISGGRSEVIILFRNAYCPLFLFQFLTRIKMVCVRSEFYLKIIFMQLLVCFVCTHQLSDCVRMYLLRSLFYPFKFFGCEALIVQIVLSYDAYVSDP